MRKTLVIYCQQSGSVAGTEDLGEYGSSGTTASYAMVFLLKGLAKKWKHEVGYFFYCGAIKSSVLKTMTQGCIENIFVNSFAC